VFGRGCPLPERGRGAENSAPPVRRNHDSAADGGYERKRGVLQRDLVAVRRDAALNADVEVAPAGAIPEPTRGRGSVSINATRRRMIASGVLPWALASEK
jgi:hypothetical protein